MNLDGTSVDDVYDITRYVQPVTVRTPLLPWPLEGFTNGKSIFLTASQVDAVADVVGEDVLFATPELGWEENVPGKGRKVLARRFIGEQTYYRFKSHWGFEPVG